MRIVFMGTPDFAVPVLRRLIADGHELVGVFSQPDKPKGRGYQLLPTPVKQAAQAAGIPVFQPATLRTDDALHTLQTLAPELIVVVAYGTLLPKAVLDLPRYGCINVHGSLLPKYRGAAPIQWTVLNGEPEGGVTVMQLNEGMDTGDILLKRAVPVGENETSGELYDRLCVLGADACADAIAQLTAGTLRPQKQNEAEATHAPMLSKEMSPVDWAHSAAQIHNQIRGLSPWPVASTVWGGKRLKLHRSCLCPTMHSGAQPGTVIETVPLRVACGGGTVLEITEVQYEGGRRMAAADFMRGHAIAKGAQFGE